MNIKGMSYDQILNDDVKAENVDQEINDYFNRANIKEEKRSTPTLIHSSSTLKPGA